MQLPLCLSKNGARITYDPVDSHAATHIKDTPPLKKLIIEVLSVIDCIDDVIEFDVDMKREIGMTDVVPIDQTDEIVYAVRKNRDDDEYVPFTKSRSAEPSSWISIALKKQPDNTYELKSAWIGRWDSPPFPGTKDANKESRPYWTRHAFVYGSQEIKLGTETKTCPW